MIPDALKEKKDKVDIPVIINPENLPVTKNFKVSKEFNAEISDTALADIIQTTDTTFITADESGAVL